MGRFRLVVEYAGTRYRGWQVQKNARSVQGELIRAVREASGRSGFTLYGSGRTDAGVHALAQVAHLELPGVREAGSLQQAVNDALPADIHVLSLEPARPGFHARHGAVGRSYLYQIARRRTAFAKPYVWWVKDRLDAARMRRAAAAFEGMRDFRAFTAADPEAGSTRVLIERVEVGEAGDLVLVRVRGSHFLWKMVRRIVGVLVEVGRGRMDESEVEALLESESPVPAQLTAPASGLFLERVVYEGEDADAPLRAATPISPSRRG